MIYAHIHADSVLACPIYWAWTAESGLVSRPLIDLLESMNEPFIYDLWTLDDNIMYITSMFSCLLFQSDVFLLVHFEYFSYYKLCMRTQYDGCKIHTIYTFYMQYTYNIHTLLSRSIFHSFFLQALDACEWFNSLRWSLCQCPELATSVGRGQGQSLETKLLG